MVSTGHRRFCLLVTVRMESKREPAGVDPLTGLRNRSYLDFLEVAFANREKTWSLIILDVDHFKLINDIYGHLAGDDVLRQVAHTIRVGLKGTDVPIRFGGDEFILVLPDTTGEGAMSLAERLMHEVRRRGHPSGPLVSLSMGVSQCRPSDTAITCLIDRADKALYRAKETGRGRFCMFSDDNREDGGSETSFSHMVGRRPELTKLRQLLDETLADTARMALVTGEAGVGKNRLVEELLNYCRFRKVTTVRSDASEHVRHQPYDLVIQPLQQALALLAEDESRELRLKMGSVHPATLELFPGLGAAALDDTVYFREERLRFRIFQDVAAIYAAVSSMRPLAVITDNLQWASEQDLDMLSYVARNTATSRILFVCLLRRNDEEPGVFQKLLSIRSSIPLLHIELGNLTQQESRNMILFALKDPNVPEELQGFLIRQSGGNPMFLRELILSLVNSGAVTTGTSGEKLYNIPDRTDIPESMGQIIAARLDRLDDRARGILRIASLSPDYLTLDLLENVVGEDPSGLAVSLDHCVQTGLLAETVETGGEVGFSFSNGAVREYLCREISESLKQVLHQRIARHLEKELLPGRDDLLSTVAYHYTRSRDAAKAAEYSLKAARQAFSMGANRDAIVWYGEFLARAEKAQADRRTMFMANMNLGMLLVITAEAERAEAFLGKALALAEGPEEHAAVEFRLGRSCHQRSRFPEAMEHFRKTVNLCDECDPGDPGVMGTAVEARLAISFICRLRGDYDAAFQWLDGALTLLQDIGSGIRDDLWAHYYTRRADVLAEQGEAAEALSLYNRALELCRKMGDQTEEALVLNNMHGSYSGTGDYDRAIDTLERVVDLTRRLDDRLGLAIAYYNIAEHNLQLNRLSAARAYFEKYMDLSREIGNMLGLGFGHYGLGMLNRLEGGNDEAESCFRRSIQVFESLECAEPLAGCRLSLAELLVESGRSGEAVTQLEKLEGMKHSPSTEALVLFIRGLVVMHDPQAGPASLEEAAGLLRASIPAVSDSQSTPEVARRYSVLSELLARTGSDSEAREALVEGSVRLADELGRIRSASARNSIVGRGEISGFLAELDRAGLCFPPRGHEFPTQ